MDPAGLLSLAKSKTKTITFLLFEIIHILYSFNTNKTYIKNKLVFNKQILYFFNINSTAIVAHQ